MANDISPISLATKRTVKVRINSTIYSKLESIAAADQRTVASILRIAAIQIAEGKAELRAGKIIAF